MASRGGGDPVWKLYNLESDIGETTDLSTQNPEVLAQLEKLLEQGRADMGDKGIQGSNGRSRGTVSEKEGQRIKKKYLGL